MPPFTIPIFFTICALVLVSVLYSNAKYRRSAERTRRQLELVYRWLSEFAPPEIDEVNDSTILRVINSISSHIRVSQGDANQWRVLQKVVAEALEPITTSKYIILGGIEWVPSKPRTKNIHGRAAGGKFAPGPKADEKRVARYNRRYKRGVELAKLNRNISRKTRDLPGGRRRETMEEARMRFADEYASRA